MLKPQGIIDSYERTLHGIYLQDHSVQVGRLVPLDITGAKLHPREVAMEPLKYIYCPLCAAALVEQIRFERVRSFCPTCGFVHFRDPKVAVIALIEWERQVLLVRRAVNPELGKWALPGGYMDADEMPAQALQRELREEVGLDIAVGQVLDIYPMAGSGQVSRGIVLVFRAYLDAPHLHTLTPRDDVSDARWFCAGDLPENLAFDSTVSLLESWQRRQA